MVAILCALLRSSNFVFEAAPRWNLSLLPYFSDIFFFERLLRTGGAVVP
jgi:hypothetical protein